MKRHPALLFFTLFISLTFLFSIVSNAMAQEDSARFMAKSTISKSPAAKAFDQKAKERLQQMSPEEVQALDKKLANALRLFYERDYSEALVLFKEVSAQVETMDVLFWLASCAQRVGELDLAIEKYERMLEIDPSLHRVRLDLAATYYQAKRYKEARQHFETVLAANPPKAVKANIEKMLAFIEAKTKRLYPHFRLGLGIQRDSNVSAGPDRETIGTPSGGLIRLSKTQKEVSDWVGVINALGSVLYDARGRNGFMWNGNGSFYLTHNRDYDDFDFALWRASTGPWWVGKRGILKVPVAYGKAYYDHDTLYDSWDFAPSYEYFFFKWLGLKATFAYVDEDYDSSDRRDQDNTNRIWEIRANFYLNDRKDVVSLFYSDENLNAKDFGYSYDGYNIGASYFKKLPWDMDCYLRYKYTDRDYKGQPRPARNFGFTGKRQDERHNFYLGLSKRFDKYLYGTVYFNYIDNDSNTPFYKFDKTIYGIQMGVRF